MGTVSHVMSAVQRAESNGCLASTAFLFLIQSATQAKVETPSQAGPETCPLRDPISYQVGNGY